jgi:threonine aldolase
MGNEIAIRVLTRPGQEVLCDEGSHVVQYELAGMAALSGVMPRVVRTGDGRLTPEVIEGALKPPAYYRSDLSLAVLENTHNLAGGTVYGLDDTRRALAACRAAKLHVHLDGARLWNAAVALGVEPRELAAGFDTVMVTLSKGLCAPAGSLLLGSRAHMEAARRVRKQLGGGMRQVGVLAAAGLVALQTMIPRLAEDHANAALIARRLEGLPGVHVSPAATNIVAAVLPSPVAPALVEKLAPRGVLATAMDGVTLRLVTHRDVSRADCERAAGLVRALLA